jgi:hypothetical protein
MLRRVAQARTWAVIVPRAASAARWSAVDPGTRCGKGGGRSTDEVRPTRRATGEAIELTVRSWQRWRGSDGGGRRRWDAFKGRRPIALKIRMRMGGVRHNLIATMVAGEGCLTVTGGGGTRNWRRGKLWVLAAHSSSMGRHALAAWGGQRALDRGLGWDEEAVREAVAGELAGRQRWWWKGRGRTHSGA